MQVFSTLQGQDIAAFLVLAGEVIPRHIDKGIVASKHNAFSAYAAAFRGERVLLHGEYPAVFVNRQPLGQGRKQPKGVEAGLIPQP